MSKTPFMPLWVSDFLGDTLDLDSAEVGAYLLLLMAQWQRGGNSLPDDEKKLQRVARCGRNWAKVWAAIERYFDRDENGVFNKRLRFEAQNVAAKRDVNSQNGARGGTAKALKRKNAELANASNSLQRNASKPEPEPKATSVAVRAQAQDEAKSGHDLTDRERLLAAIGADPISGMMGPSGSILGRQTDMQTAAGWTDLGLTIDQQCRIIGDRMASAKAKSPHFVPRSFAYFTGAMQDAVSARSTAGAAPRKPQSTGPFGDPTLDFIARQVGQA